MDDGDTVFLHGFADCGDLVGLGIRCSREAVQVEPHHGLSEETAGSLAHLDVDADEAAFGVDERDVDIGLLALVKASKAQSSFVVHLDEVVVVLEPAVDGSFFHVERGFQIRALLTTAVPEVGIVLEGFLIGKHPFGDCFFTGDGHGVTPLGKSIV